MRIPWKFVIFNQCAGWFGFQYKETGIF